jgi:glutathione S-transferase
VQRAVILMRAKDVEFDVTYINLRDKPYWFLKISPHGKVPVLLVDDQPLFESNAIAEFLDEMVTPQLHPADPIKRARNRAWTDFTPTFAANLNSVTYAKSKEALPDSVAAARKVLDRLEDALKNERQEDGPYFNGPHLSLVDAAYAPFLQRFNIAEQVLKTRLLEEFPNVKAWSETLLGDARVRAALPEKFPEEFRANLKRRETYAWELLAEA